MTPECQVCGFPNLRAAAHAGWCERVTERLLANDAVCEHCGRDCVNPAGLGAHRRCCNAPDPASSVASRGSAAAVDATENGAPGPVVAEAIGQRPEHRLLVDAPAPQSKEAVARTTASITAG